MTKTIDAAASFSDNDLKAAFHFLAPDERGALLSFLTPRDCTAGSVLIHDGEKSDYVGFLVSGRLSVKKKTEFFGKYIIVAILESGTIVGEGAMSDEMARSVIISALEDSRLLILTREKMDVLAIEKPVLATKLYQRFLYVSHVRLQKAGERLSHLL